MVMFVGYEGVPEPTGRTDHWVWDWCGTRIRDQAVGSVPVLTVGGVRQLGRRSTGGVIIWVIGLLDLSGRRAIECWAPAAGAFVSPWSGIQP